MFIPKIIGFAWSKPWVALTLSQDQGREVRTTEVDATAGTAVWLRVIDLLLPSGPIETLVTTLTEKEMPEEAFGEWYFMR